MTKSILISCRPEMCNLISDGRKTIDIRKTRPSIETPFKCYIYCTLYNNLKNTNNNLWITNHNGYNYLGNGKVIGEFICNSIHQFKVFENGSVQDWNFASLFDSRMLYEDIADYVGRGNYGYAWCISDFKLYDSPKELSNFYHDCGDEPKCDGCVYQYIESNESVGYYVQCNSKMENFKPLCRSPRSWCYVEEINEYD